MLQHFERKCFAYFILVKNSRIRNHFKSNIERGKARFRSTWLALETEDLYHLVWPTLSTCVFIVKHTALSIHSWVAIRSLFTSDKVESLVNDATFLHLFFFFDLFHDEKACGPVFSALGRFPFFIRELFPTWRMRRCLAPFSTSVINKNVDIF